MYDPQAVRAIGLLIAAVFYFGFIVACLYGIFMLAKIRAQTRGINERLDLILARMSSRNPDDSKPS